MPKIQQIINNIFPLYINNITVHWGAPTMWNLKVIAIMLLLIISIFVFNFEFDEQAWECKGVGVGVVEGILEVDNTEIRSDGSH